MHKYSINSLIKVGRIVFIHRNINKKGQGKRNKTKHRKPMYSEQLYTIAIFATNKSNQAVQLIYCCVKQPIQLIGHYIIQEIV